jgi:pSer/pThr/pTyr-binding forkhead associated (FHA) protein
MASDETVIAATAAKAEQQFDIVLKPISHPDLDEIRIEDSLFAIGRGESPFVTYERDIVINLSRRHARIFYESGAVYIADLDSKNGTAVNGTAVREKPSRVNQGDEICFGGKLSYRVQLRPRLKVPGTAARLISVTLTPEHADLGLLPIVIGHFPFLISKADETFARYKDQYPHQVNYMSRRHAHVFLKGGAPYIEDLGSKNGTFVASKRLEEHAVPLNDGDIVAFGGSHFVYKVSVRKEVEPDPTLTKLSPIVEAAAEVGDIEKTTFVAAPDSFLDIFCADDGPQAEEGARHEDAKRPEEVKKEPEAGRQRGKLALFVSELGEAFAGGERSGSRRPVWIAGGGGVLAVVVALLLYLFPVGAPDKELADLLAKGEYTRAVTVANQYLEKHRDDAEINALGTEALLKAKVPDWLRLIKAGDFDGAGTALAAMKGAAPHVTDAQALVGELGWVGDIEKFVIGRGGAEAPIRIYADEDKLTSLLKRWDEDTQARQRAFAKVASVVPEFRDAYADVLSHLRKLQSDQSVYSPAIERLKATINTELNQDRADALPAMLTEYAEKYPRLGGLDAVREDLRQYTSLEADLRARRLDRLVARLGKVRFVTPPFEAKYRALTASGRLPPAEVIQQYEAVAKAWRAGDTKEAFAALQKMAGGSWADAAAKQTELKKSIAEQFGELQKSRGAKGYEERLLAFYGALDGDEDVYFIRAIGADVAAHKDKALRQAQEQMNRAQASWRQYKEQGGIEGRQRLESEISGQFRSQAKLLAEAQDNARQAMQTYRQLKASEPAPWAKSNDEIGAEVEQQRRALQELRTVLEPGLLKAKLALLGGSER